MSEHEIVNVRILQGSCLGPLLFLVYINDIFSSTEINMRLFADDACLSYQHSNPAWVNSVINEELRKVVVWFVLINFSLTILKLKSCFLTILLKNVISK